MKVRANPSTRTTPPRRELIPLDRSPHEPAISGVHGVDLNHLFDQVDADANNHRHDSGNRLISLMAPLLGSPEPENW